MKIYRVIQTKFNVLVDQNAYMIINLPPKDIRVTNISKSFTSYKMATETSWHKIWNEITSLSPYVLFNDVCYFEDC